MTRIFLWLACLAPAAPGCAQAPDVAASAITATPVSKSIDAARLLRDVQILAADDMQGRGVGTPGGAKARAYVLKRFRESGIRPYKTTYEQPFGFTNRGGSRVSGVNVIGYVEGSVKKARPIVLSAHYDHVGTSGGQVYNGADDNASGTAALFAIAEHLKKHRPEHTVIFAAFDAEESGLRGARAFVASPPVARSSLAMNINMDMLSRNDKNELYASGTYHHPQFRPALQAIAKTSRIKLLLGHDRPEQGHDDWTSQSDHGAFHDAKIPFLYFGVEDHADYHQPTDDFARIQPEFYVRAVEVVLEALKRFDRELK